MDEQEAYELFRQYRATRDIGIRNRLVENYIDVARILAKKFAGRGVEYDDLLQVASEALISGVEKFDPDLGNKFTTYITPTITGVIKNYFRDYSHSIRIPRRLYALAARIKEQSQKFYQAHGCQPTVKQLAAELETDEESVIEALECKPPQSLDATLMTEEGEEPKVDVVSDGLSDFDRFEDSEALKAGLKDLDDGERKIIALRFLQGKSQSETGKILGVSQMFVSRAERKILQKLKERIEND